MATSEEKAEAERLDEGWSHWEEVEDEKEEISPDPLDPISEVSSPPQRNPLVLIESLPPQLHPAVSMGMQRVSSCYLSLDGQRSMGSGGSRCSRESVADLLQLWEDAAQYSSATAAPASSSKSAAVQRGACGRKSADDEDEGGLTPDNARTKGPEDQLLYHDILMHVFTFLSASDLRAFSETARRPNFETFYYLQLQLQRALVPLPPTSSTTTIAAPEQADEASSSSSSPPDQEETLLPTPGVGCLVRLAGLDRVEADATVQEFLDSNSTLKSMPLFHSLAYIRQVLRSHQPTTSSQALASAALLVAVLGAAAVSTADSGSIMSMVEDLPSATELSNVLFKLGFVGSLMGAAKTVSESDRAERLRLAVQQQRASLLGGGDREDGGGRFSLSRFMHAAYCAAYGYEDTATPDLNDRGPPSPARRRAKRGVESSATISTDNDAAGTAAIETTDRKIPSGCVGAYSRAIHRASVRVRDSVKQSRRARFEALSDDRKREVSGAFIDACCSDDTFDVVRDFVQTRGIVDVEGFYVGSDGTETCALHAAAFHGSCKILQFLCHGIDETDSSKDGGLCDVDRKDANGWTAVHFAAGANSSEAVRVLASHGADLSVEAANGYTPLHWAMRLQHQEVADELRERMSETEQNQLRGWIMSRQPLSAIASRFFAMIPSH